MENPEIKTAKQEIAAFFYKNWKVNLVGLIFLVWSLVDAIQTGNFSDLKNAVGLVLIALFSDDSIATQFITKLFNRK